MKYAVCQPKEHKAPKSEVIRFRKATISADAEAHPAVGLATDCRLESKKVTGFALALKDQILHVSIFARTERNKKNGYESRILRFTQRRRKRI